MRRLAARTLGCLLAGGLAAAGGAWGQAPELSALERDGQRIYLEGASPSGARIGARIGLGGMDISGQVAACGNCHGEDGRGRPEGGVEPSVVIWSELTKSYGHRHANGRQHGPFDERLLKRALVEGRDPDGQPLDVAMPRYTMSERDFGALVAYLKALERLRDPGITEETLRIGTFLPAAGRLAEVGTAVREVLQAGFAAINARGGIHGRKLELVTLALPEAGAASAATATAETLARQPVFALLAPLSAGLEAQLADLAGRTRLPVIGPLTLFPEDPRESNPQVFHLLPGVPELGLLLARQAALEAGLAVQPALLLHAASEVGAANARAVREQMHAAGWMRVELLALEAGHFAAERLAHEQKTRGTASVLVLGAGAAMPVLARAGERIGWLPRWLLPGPLATREALELPAAVAERLTLAYASAPGDRRADAMRELAALTGPQPRHLAVQVAAHAASQVLVEALKRSGRDLSRRKLIATLEKLNGFETGLVPPLSYNADRRIGAWGGYLVGIDTAARSMRSLGGYQRLP